MLDSKRSNTPALYTFLRRLKLHAFNYTAVTYAYFSLRSWDTDHCTQDETAILMMYRFMPNSEGKLVKIP